MNEKGFRNTIKESYGFDSWAGSISGEEHEFIWNFFMNGRESPGWNLAESMDYGVEKERNMTRYLWKKEKEEKEKEKEKEMLILVDVIETPSLLDSHEAVIDFISECQAPHLPEGKSHGIDVGDISFLSHGEPISSILFARGNLALSVRSVGSVDVAVDEFAQNVDYYLSEKPPPSDVEDTPGIEEFESECSCIRLHEKVALKIKVSDPLKGRLRYKFFSTGGKIIREKDTIFFYPFSVGKHEIESYVINEEDLACSSVTTVEVVP